jgi:hypothetical protein
VPGTLSRKTNGEEKTAGKLPGLTVSELRTLKKDDLASAYEDLAWIGLHKMKEGRLMEEANSDSDRGR